MIRRVRPQRVLTQSPDRLWARIYASHPDHLATGEATTCAVYPDARNPFAHPELLEEGWEPWTVSELWLMATDKADRFVDITNAVDRKLAALHVPREPASGPGGHRVDSAQLARSHRRRRRFRTRPGRRGVQGRADRMTEFKGWPAEALTFWDGLELDNSKAYWTANKALYEASVKRPMVALGAEIADIGPLNIFRPYRDVRFSKDKTPYKTHIGAVTESQGGTGYYVALSATGLDVAAGYYNLAADQLERYREAVAGKPGDKLAPIVAALRKAGYKIQGESLKLAPRGYPKDHPRVDLLRHKQLYTWKQFGRPKWVHTRGALDRIRTVWADAAPLCRWLDTHVGPSKLPPPEPR